MSATGYWLRLTLQRHWLSLVVLTLVIAVASGTVMALVAGALRGGNAWDRFTIEGKASHALISPLMIQPDYDKVRTLRYVEGVVDAPFANVFVTDPPMNPSPNVIFHTNGPFGTAMERQFIVEGREPDQAKANEALVSERFVADTGRGVGSTLTTVVPAPGYGRFTGSVVPKDFIPRGEQVVLQVVGVARVPTVATAFGIDSSWIIPTEAYWKANADAIARSVQSSDPAGGVRVGAIVRLKNGQVDVPRLNTDITAIVESQAKAARAAGTPIGPDVPIAADVTDLVAEASPTRATTRLERLAVLGLALAAGFAALIVVGLLVGRRAKALTAEATRLAPLGLTRADLTLAGASAVVASGLIGALLGATFAVALSARFPIGLSRLVEPTPGVTIDWTVLLVGALTTTALVAGVAILAARRGSQVPLTSPVSKGGGAQSWFGRIPSLPVALGARRALSPNLSAGAGRSWIAPALGVAGLVAGATIGLAVHNAIEDPLLYSPGPGATVQLGFDSQIVNDPKQMEARLRASKAPADGADIAAIYNVRGAVANINGKPLLMTDIGPSNDRPARPVLEGRLPETEGEIAVGPTAAREVGAQLGDDVIVTAGTEGASSKSFRVVGIALSDWQGNASYDRVSIVNQSSFTQVFGKSFGQFYSVVVFQPGTDPTEWINEFSRVNDAYDFADPIEQPRAIENLARLPALPWILAAFLSFLGVVAFSFGLAGSQRSSQRGHAVLRALGFTRGGSRQAIAWEGAFIASLALLIGVPIGTLLGRAGWREISLQVPVAYATPTTGNVLLAVVAVVMSGALLLSVVPSWRAGRIRVPELLRGE